MNKAVIGTLVVVGVLGAAGGGYWFGTQKLAGPAQSTGGASGSAQSSGKGGGAQGGQSAIVAVEAIKVVTAAIPQVITTVGSLRSDESITLRPESAGRISAITFQEGQRVAKGAPLVTLDPAMPRAELEQAKANYVLAQRNFISGQAKDEAENNVKVA